MLRAKCRGMDSDMFVPPYDPRTREGPAPEAMAVCNGDDGYPPCTVRAECGAYGRKYKCSGCWGGQPIYLGRRRKPRK
jgi:hypothetical protein